MPHNNSQLTLFGGLAAAVGAGLCCVGPFVLLSLGISGVWIANLTLLEPYRPLFIAITFALFAWAGWKLHLPVRYCTTGDACADPRLRKRRQWIFWIAALAALALLTGPYWIPLIA